MQAIDLSKVEPFDLLLTTNHGLESAIIRFGQAILRRRPARYSHVAMFMTPTVLVEANDAGVLFECFTNRTPDDSLVIKKMSKSQKKRWSGVKRLKTKLIINTDSKLPRIFGVLTEAKLRSG
jgi:hypothetical protein